MGCAAMMQYAAVGFRPALRIRCRNAAGSVVGRVNRSITMASRVNRVASVTARSRVIASAITGAARSSNSRSLSWSSPSMSTNAPSVGLQTGGHKSLSIHCRH
jgi:hypothetical protein